MPGAHPCKPAAAPVLLIRATEREECFDGRSPERPSSAKANALTKAAVSADTTSIIGHNADSARQFARQHATFRADSSGFGEKARENDRCKSPAHAPLPHGREDRAGRARTCNPGFGGLSETTLLASGLACEVGSGWLRPVGYGQAGQDPGKSLVGDRASGTPRPADLSDRAARPYALYESGEGPSRASASASSCGDHALGGRPPSRA